MAISLGIYPIFRHTQMDAVAVDDIWEMRWNMIVSKHLILQRRRQWRQWYNHAKPGRIPSFNGCHEPVISVCSESAQERLTLWVRYQLNLNSGPEAGPAVSQLSWVAQYIAVWLQLFPFQNLEKNNVLLAARINMSCLPLMDKCQPHAFSVAFCHHQQMLRRWSLCNAWPERLRLPVRSRHKTINWGVVLDGWVHPSCLV